MKINLASFIIIFFSLKLFGIDDYSAIDKRSASIPDSLKTIEQITSYLTKNLTREDEKARAFYIWISHNIRYDLTRKNTKKEYQTKRELIDDVLEKKQGVCEHYSQLFYAFCQKAGIKSYVIRGYARAKTGKIMNSAHCWNAVLIDSAYYNIDVTWAAGYLMNNAYIHEFRDDYFLINPAEFTKTHLPFDPVWQFSDNPINVVDFNIQDFSKDTVKGTYNYRSMIARIESQDVLTNLEQSNKRLFELGEINDLSLAEISENELQINHEKCRIAIDSLNHAIDSYNLYIVHKNGRFRKPLMDDNKLKELIFNIENPLTTSENILKNIFTFNYDLNAQIVVFKESVQLFKSKLKVEKIFIDKYIKTKKSARFLLFI